MTVVGGKAAAPVLLVLLCIGLQLHLANASSSSGNDTEEYSCDALSKVPSNQRCSFIRSSCESESLLPYAEWYHCHLAQANVVLQWLYVGAVCCLLPLAFCLLGDTAEFYIAPIMAHVSQAVPKMRPRFAGVTFVALGNGAPDLSANIAAISAGEITLSAGALTGAAMFVQCIVAAELVALAGPSGIKCGGAMLRDVGVYCLAILSVLLAFYIGQVSKFFVGWAVTLYLVYMIWVFAGDEWHQRGRPRLKVHSLKDMLASYLPGNELPPPRQSWAGIEGPTGSGAAGPQRFSSGVGYNTRAELEESLLPWAVAEEEPDQFDTAVEYSGRSQPTALPSHMLATADRLAALRASSGMSARGSVGRLSAPGLRPDSIISMQLSTELSDFGTVQFSHRGSAIGEDGAAWAGISSTEMPLSPHAAAGRMHSQLSQPARWSGTGATGWPGQPLQHSQQPHLVNMGRHSYLDPRTYRQLVWADLADDEEEEARLEREIAQQIFSRREANSFASAGNSYQPPSGAALTSFSSLPVALTSNQQAAGTMQEQAPRLEAARTPEPAAAMESGLLLSPFGSAAPRTAPSTPLSTAAEPQGHVQHASGAEMVQHQQGVLLHGSGTLLGSWQQLQWEVTLGNSEEWQDAGAVRQLFRKVTFPLLLPAYLGQRLTIPFASSAGYSREWLIAALLCCPLALILYLGLLSMPAIFAACSCGIVAASGAYVSTMKDAPGQMPVQGLGGIPAAAVPGVLAVLAFCMGVVWIDTVATEVVGVITFLGGLASLPAGVMGLTLLAWGNSLGDFFGNRAMAKAGHGSTAITACFAAPLFNMLMSLSLGFSSYLHKLGLGAVRVHLTPEVALGCMFLIGYNIITICIGRMCGNRLPPWFAYFARGYYALYFGLSVFSGFYGLKPAQR